MVSITASLLNSNGHRSHPCLKPISIMVRLKDPLDFYAIVFEFIYNFNIL